MVQFYISSGVIIASIILQFLLIKSSVHINRLISYNADTRAKKVDLTAVNSVKIFKWSIGLSIVLFIWSLILSYGYKELFIGILFLTLLIAVILAIIIINNALISVGMRNEVQLAHIEKMKFDFSGDTIKELKAVDTKIKVSTLIIALTNTVGLAIVYMVFKDALIANFVNIGLAIVSYLLLIKSLKKQHDLTFEHQEDKLSEEYVTKFIDKVKNEDTFSKSDIEDMLEDIRKEKEQAKQETNVKTDK